MLKTKRQTEIIEYLRENTFATVDELSRKLYASHPTIRRDLTLLESEGYIKRCHGGATILEDNAKPPIYFRSEQNTKEKTKMCRVAAELIGEKSVILIDASSTVFHISDFLSRDLEITVITNGLPAATKFADAGYTVYSVGGRLLKESQAYVGKPAEEALLSYNADLMFFSVASLSDDGILSDWSESEASLRIAMTKSAKKVVLMCDSTKFGTRSTFTLFPLSKVDFVICDKPLSDDLINQYSLKERINAPAYLYEVSH